jgi:RHS repeat-associated protein
MAAALVGYSQRSGPDDFSALTAFLEKHPRSSWNAALLTGLGSEYYNTAHYSLALEVWQRAWSHAKEAHNTAENATINHAVSELAFLYARLGRMTELEALLKSVERRVFIGGEAVKINGAREGLWMMKNRPEVSFRCGPLALHRIKLATEPENPATAIIEESVSTQKGLSLSQVAQLSKKIGINYQMAFREKGAAFVVPSVVHWKVGHFAAMVRQEGDRYLLEDPTFGNTVWPTQAALEEETSGYFLIPPAELPPGWRSVGASEGESIWGKGQTAGNDPDVFTCRDMQTRPCGSRSCHGMAVSSVHLMLANLQVRDIPVGYTPPVGPSVRFAVRFNSQSTIPQAAAVTTDMLGTGWTYDWLSFIQDQPQSPMADVKYFAGGGGARTFTGFKSTNQTFASQAYDQSLLRRISTNRYELLWPDGSRQIFAQPDGSIGSMRNVYLTQVLDASSNAITLSYNTTPEGVMHLIAITDAIGQVTTLTYGVPATHYPGFDMPADPNKLTKVTDPFGRFATFDYAPTIIDWDYTVTTACPIPVIAAHPLRVWWLQSITDVLGLVSQFTYLDTNTLVACATCPTNAASNGCVTNNYSVAFIHSMFTPYDTTTFYTGQGSGTNATMRFVETLYPDGSRERVEYNQGADFDGSDPPATVPKGMNIANQALQVRNTYYWDRNACATAYGDYHKARIYHWLHAANPGLTAGILESSKEPLENRVWYVHPGGSPRGPLSNPTRIGRVLDDGSTQLYTFAYNDFGHITNMVDPIGRAFSYLYDTNGIDLLEVRQTQAGNNELLLRRNYNAQHRVLNSTDAAGQTNSFTYNARGQLLSETNPKGQTMAYTYDVNGYLAAVDGPLPGTNDTATFTYDSFGRIRTATDVSGYALKFDYDAMDRITRITYPDSTFAQYSYDRLSLASIRDRAGRTTFFEHDNMRQIRKQTDSLGRVTLFDWCRCGALKSLIDPMGRKTTWTTDVQNRPVAKQYPDGSQIQYFYESTTSRLRQIIDETQQITELNYNIDNSIHSISYANCTVPTPAVTYAYDPNYQRVTSMTDGAGTTLYSYVPITDVPTLGAGQLASVDGPLPDDSITYAYDELGRRVHMAINGVDSALSFDETGRLIGATNALGAFAYVYDGSSARLISRTLPNGQVEDRSYNGHLLDFTLARITHRQGSTATSEFIYGRDVAAERIVTWSQQAGAQPPLLYSFGYDNTDQLLSVTVTNAGALVHSFDYSYDRAGNRLSEQIDGTHYASTYNSLNEISTTTAPVASRTNEWDGANRLVAVNAGNRRTEFRYDGLSRLASIRLLTNGIEASFRRFVWCGDQLCEERDVFGAVKKRFLPNGVKLETGPDAGSYYYTRDHLGSIRELTDRSGHVRARYAYDPFGRRTRVAGELEADFGFAGMFWAAEVNLALTHYRVYDPELGRWLSRDPLRNAERREGPNLYVYVGNEPINHIDPRGLNSANTGLARMCTANPVACREVLRAMGKVGAGAGVGGGAAAAGAAGGAAVLGATTLAQNAPEAECLLPTLPEVPTIVETAPSVAPDLPVFEQTLPGIGPDTVNELGNAAPDLPQTVDSIAPEVETVQQELTPAQDWLLQTLEATADWRSRLPTLEQQGDALRSIFDSARIVFGITGIFL